MVFSFSKFDWKEKSWDDSSLLKIFDMVVEDLVAFFVTDSLDLNC